MRLLEEARSASALNHPNVCTIYEVSEEGERAFIVMEYVDGRSLETLLPGGLPIDEAVEYAHQIADALAHAHEHGVVHGDLKSANVLVTSDGRVKVVDFGLSRRQPRDTDETFSATTPVVAGTPYAMAPEQLTGSHADAQSDIWALSHFRRGRALADSGQWAAAKSELAAARELLAPDEQERRCEVLVELAKSAFWLMDIPAVRRFATEALPIAEALRRDDLWGDAMAWLGPAMDPTEIPLLPLRPVGKPSAGLAVSGRSYWLS